MKKLLLLLCLTLVFGIGRAGVEELDEEWAQEEENSGVVTLRSDYDR